MVKACNRLTLFRQAKNDLTYQAQCTEAMGRPANVSAGTIFTEEEAIPYHSCMASVHYATKHKTI